MHTKKQDTCKTLINGGDTLWYKPDTDMTKNLYILLFWSHTSA